MYQNPGPQDDRIGVVECIRDGAYFKIIRSWGRCHGEELINADLTERVSSYERGLLSSNIPLLFNI